MTDPVPTASPAPMAPMLMPASAVPGLEPPPVKIDPAVIAQALADLKAPLPSSIWAMGPEAYRRIANGLIVLLHAELNP